MVRKGVTLSGIVVVVVLVGCGGASHKGTATTATRVAALPAGAPPALRGVAGRVLTAGGLAGFTPQGRRLLGINAASWVQQEELPPTERTREAARLQGLGFIAGVHERLVPVKGGSAEGLSIVEQFGSPRAARTELADQVERDKGPGVTAFAVPDIPGARGFGSTGAQDSGLNVAFAEGSYYYLVGAGWPAGFTQPPTRAALIAAAQGLERRVHG